MMVGMSPVRDTWRGCVEVLARDAELQWARGTNSYKGTGVMKGRRRLGARVLAVLAALVVAVVSVEAYGTLGEPDYGMIVSSREPSNAPAPQCTGLTLPAELLRFTDDASEIAATHYFEVVVAYAWNTGDTQYLSEHSVTRLPVLPENSDDIDRLYGGGGWASGAKFTDVVLHTPWKASSDIENYGEDTYGVRCRSTS